MINVKILCHEFKLFSKAMHKISRLIVVKADFVRRMTSTLPGERPSVREILDSELVLTKDQVHTVLVWSHQTFKEITNV